jgi:hypothetical protein
MRNIFIIGALLAISLSASATPDCGVTAKSEFIVDVGVEQVAMAVTPVVAIEYAYVVNPIECTISDESIGSGFEWTDHAMSGWEIKWGESADVLFDPGRQRPQGNSGNDSATLINYDEAINRLSTDLSFRKARDGLRC